MKKVILIFSSVLLIYFIAVKISKIVVVKKYKNSAIEIEKLFNIYRFDTSKYGKFINIIDLNLVNISVFKNLKKKNIINNDSQLFYKSKDCICLINKSSEFFFNLFGANDYVIIRNYDWGKFSYGLDDIYSLNQIEENQHLIIDANQIDVITNLFIINH